MFLDFISNLPIARPITVPPELQRALTRRQAEKIAELRANGFHALARWFRENPASIA